MRRLYLIILLFIPLFLVSCTGSDKRNTKNPNLLIIHTDEHSFRTLGCYRELLSHEQAFVWGDGVAVETPNIDWLAQNGVLYSKCYATTPLCSPSRGTFLTGTYPQHNGVIGNDVPMNDEMTSFASILREEGYFTGYIGKWHLDGEGKPQWEPERNFGFEDNRYMYNRGHWKKLEDSPDGPRVASIDKNGLPITTLNEADEVSFTTDFLTDRTIDMISQNRDTPFCIMVSIPDPHGPDRVRPPYDTMYTDLPFSAPVTYNKSNEGVPSWAQKRIEDSGIDQSQYFGMVKCIDDNVGRILDHLRREKLLENTIVVFTSDHGDLRGEHHRHNKGVPLEASAKIPFIISYPQKLLKGAVVKNTISTVDFAPTILEIMEVDHDGKKMDGTDHSKATTDIAFIRSSGTWRSDRSWIGAFTSRYKLILSTSDDPWLLDLERDPGELINYLSEPEYGAKVKELATKLHEYGVQFEDPFLQNTKMSDDLEELMNLQLKKSAVPAPETPPNLVLIITDDQGYGDLSLHGNKIMETPNLDAIGLNGARLDNFHVSPVCAPTRAALLTGRRPMSTGTYYVTRGGEVMDSEEYTIAEVLKDNGYSTGYFGKWHNGAHHPHHPLSQGFDSFLGFTAGHVNNYFDPELEENGKIVKKEGYIADIFTDKAINYITEQQDEPFFCYLAYNTPHAPFQVPDQYYNMYIDKVEEKDSALRIMNATVYGMVKNIDDNVGRLMKTLDELNLKENTIVVFLTDNGPNTYRFNGHMKGKKGWVNDGGVRVPCFIQWDGHIPKNKMVSTMTAHIDLLPTLTSMMGVDFIPKKEVHGVDLSDRIYGADKEEERYLFTHVNQGVKVKSNPGAVRNPEWRLTFREDDQLELTSRNDIKEARNLADSLPYLADSLKQLYDKWFQPLGTIQIPPVPVGIADSVVFTGHEGFLTGDASYRWSTRGYSNDWVTGLDADKSSVYWPLKNSKPGVYTCFVRYTSSSGNARIMLDISGNRLERTVPAFVPVMKKSHSRIERTFEMTEQSWARTCLGEVLLEEGLNKLTINGSGDALEILSVTLTGPEKNQITTKL